MAYPTAPGTPDHSGGYLPNKFAKKLLVAFYAATCFTVIANTDHEGDITRDGCSVRVRQRPTITIRTHVKNGELVYEHPAPGYVDLLIDQGKYYGIAIDDVDALQSDIDMQNEWAADGGEQMKVEIDTAVLADIYSDVDAANTGATAGKKSGDINLGTTGTWLDVDDTNAMETITACGLVLDEQNIPRGDGQRWIVLPHWYGKSLKDGNLSNASFMGDGKSVLRGTGLIGQVDDFNVILSNNIATGTDTAHTVYHCLFGHKKGLTFASQMLKNDILTDTKSFSKLLRGLHVYGYKVTKPEALGHLYIAKA